MVAEIVVSVEIGVAESAVVMSAVIGVVIRKSFISVEFPVANCRQSSERWSAAMKFEKRRFDRSHRSTVSTPQESWKRREVRKKALRTFTPNMIRRHPEMLEESILRAELPLIAIPTDVPSCIFIIPPIRRGHLECCGVFEKKAEKGREEREGKRGKKGKGENSAAESEGRESDSKRRIGRDSRADGDRYECPTEHKWL